MNCIFKGFPLPLQLKCRNQNNSETQQIDLKQPNILSKFKKKLLFIKNNGANFSCSIVIVYQSKLSGDLITKESTEFEINLPQPPPLPQPPQPQHKRSTLAWAIPVVFFAVVLVAGLLLVASKYRRNQISFPAKAACGKYNRLMNDYAYDNGNKMSV